MDGRMSNRVAATKTVGGFAAPLGNPALAMPFTTNTGRLDAHGGDNAESIATAGACDSDAVAPVLAESGGDCELILYVSC